MRNALMLAAGALALALSAPLPAQAFDDSLPHYAPWRRHYAEHVYEGRRYRKARAYRHVVVSNTVYCDRWTWREYCRPYRLGGYFTKNPDFRRLPWYR